MINFDNMKFKEHDIIQLITEDYSITINDLIIDVNHETVFLPKGTHGTIVGITSKKANGCYVKFPYIQEKYPDTDSVVWVLFTEMEKI